MLDEKGRLFGKINIVDLLIVLVLIAAVAFVGIKYVMPHNDGGADLQDIQMVVHCDMSKRYVVEQLVNDSPVYDNSEKIDLGVVRGWTTEAYFEATKEDDKQPEYIERPDMCIVELTIDAKGTMGTYGANINGKLFGLGHTMVISVGPCKFYVSLKTMTVK